MTSSVGDRLSVSALHWQERALHQVSTKGFFGVFVLFLGFGFFFGVEEVGGAGGKSCNSGKPLCVLL